MLHSGLDKATLLEFFKTIFQASTFIKQCHIIPFSHNSGQQSKRLGNRNKQQFNSFCLPRLSAACPPDQVSATLDCDANEALISWRGQPEMNSYTAAIEDQGQGLLGCSTTNTSCTIPNLKCGQNYTITVSHHDGMCPSMPSQPVYMESGKKHIRFDFTSIFCYSCYENWLSLC